MNEAERTSNHLQNVRETGPLVHNITNYVVMNNTANALLSLGASPVMAHAKEEVADMAAIASALVINIGTLSPHWVEAMEIAMKSAAENGAPIIIDPVGAGATPYRTDTLKKLIGATSPDIIRGNASEIGALYTADVKTKGVDSTQESHSSVNAAHHLAGEYSCVVVVSGETDYIVSENETRTVHNGHSLMGRVTGMGCTASALIGAFAGAGIDPVEASLSAMRVMGIAGEMAAEKSAGPGSFQTHFLDALYVLDNQGIESRLKPEETHA
ncbi:hydroxyethylthiazole kinase [Rhodohalobacter sp. SW132]|uniref:hydroxyethylthiazole kinase n=1 Tax=Rhodohalobacter sp. SW132 TaxID=2293433 RepID=UPI000E2659BC|nr:hydroxyethylthiazole kinase [Rhodohalobacter sp. SW132]REL39003.1 hydroxyethylthiazole kinase [Rhodohalobacter sp. SW132]